MAQYKYLFERPLADASTAEKLMDFDAVLSKSVKMGRLTLIKNTVLITVLASVGILWITYIFQSPSPMEPTRESQMPAVQEDSTFVEYESPASKPDMREPGQINDTASTVKPKNRERTEKVEKEPVIKKETEGFKIQESFPKENVIVQAEPQQGFDDLYEYFNEVLTYPSDLTVEKVEGNLVVEFMILKDGSVGNVKLLNKLHPILDSIATASVKNMPAWNPASVNGEKVDTKHSIPLLFNIGDQ